MSETITALSEETKTINDRKTKVDNEISTQKRINQFNDSARKRYEIWTSIVIDIVIGLIVYLGLIFLAQSFTFIPSSVFDLASAITFVVIAWVVYKKYLIIQSRDKLNFDELDLAPMPAQGTAVDVAKTSAALSQTGDLTGITAANQCTGSSCCGANTKWSETENKCVKDANAFTTLDQAFALGEIDFAGRPVGNQVGMLGKPNILPDLGEYEKIFTHA